MDRLTHSLGAVNQKTISGRDYHVLASLMRGYDARWSAEHSNYVVEEIENEFCHKIRNPKTGYPLKGLWHAGKIDGLVKYGEKRFLLEHKTTSEDISDADAVYWRRLAIDSQISGYMLSLWDRGIEVDGTVYDVIRKPSIRPRRLTKENKAEIQSGSYFGRCLDGRKINQYLEMESEDDELFSFRLLADAIQNPANYYQRKQIVRTRQDLAEYAQELYQIGGQIRESKQSGVHFRNSSACTQFGSTCEYLPLCCGYDSFGSDSWQRRKRAHAELGDSTNDLPDREIVVTGSRLKTFLACRRKDHYRYGLRIEKADGEISEALSFGAAFHEALAAWWSYGVSGLGLEAEGQKEPKNEHGENAGIGESVAEPGGCDQEADEESSKFFSFARG
jgi:hypothetical protein